MKNYLVMFQGAEAEGNQKAEGLGVKLNLLFGIPGSITYTAQLSAEQAEKLRAQGFRVAVDPLV